MNRRGFFTRLAALAAAPVAAKLLPFLPRTGGVVPPLNLSEPIPPPMPAYFNLCDPVTPNGDEITVHWQLVEWGTSLDGADTVRVTRKEFDG